MKGPEKLGKQEDHWETAMGLVFPGERVVIRGKDLFHELKDMRWMELLLYSITGRRFTDNQIRLFEGIWVLCTSYPDSRIWNNRITALAGTARSTINLGIGAAVSVSEATVYGQKPVIRSIDFLIRAKNGLDTGEKLSKIINDELAHSRGIMGYGRPLVNEDERIKPLMELATTLGFNNGQHVTLAFDIENFLLKTRYRMKMNIAALISALAADQGLSPREHYHYMVLCFTAGMFPCFIDSATGPEGSFLPLPCNRITYEGPPPRHWR